MSRSRDFAALERLRAVAWKQSTVTLPEAARRPAPYVAQDGTADGPELEVCLPSELSAWSLLPEVRDQALELFVELGIPWHSGVDGGPSNHLLSSQVQCVNALGQMVSDPTRIVRAFGPVLGTVEVEEIEPGRWLTFEYIGPTDFLNEAPGGYRIRGAHCTSVDAAFLHRTAAGDRELVLVEWKYTERYGRRAPDAKRDEVRRRRYGALVDDPTGPIDGSVLAFDELLQEPLYQLVRQQLLAHELEKARVMGTDRVRVVHVKPAGNLAYQQSLHIPALRALGATVDEVWTKLLRHTDRFVALDSAIFLDPEITSHEYVARYGGDVNRAAVRMPEKR